VRVADSVKNLVDRMECGVRLNLSFGRVFNFRKALEVYSVQVGIVWSTPNSPHDENVGLAKNSHIKISHIQQNE
jgi:hypothetical protein